MNKLLSLLLMSCSINAGVTTVLFHQCEDVSNQSFDDIHDLAAAFSSSFDKVITESWLLDYDFKPEILLKLDQGNATLCLNKNTNLISVVVQSQSFDVSRLAKCLEKVVKFAFYVIEDQYASAEEESGSNETVFELDDVSGDDYD